MAMVKSASSGQKHFSISVASRGSMAQAEMMEAHVDEFTLMYSVGSDTPARTVRIEAARETTKKMVHDTTEQFQTTDKGTVDALFRLAWAIRESGDFSPESYAFAVAAVHYRLRELSRTQSSVGLLDYEVELEGCVSDDLRRSGGSTVLQRLAAGWVVSRIRPHAPSGDTRWSAISRGIFGDVPSNASRATVVLTGPPSAGNAQKLRHALVYVDETHALHGLDGRRGQFLATSPLESLSGFHIIDLVPAPRRSGRPAAYVLLAWHSPGMSPLGDTVFVPDGMDSEVKREQVLVLLDDGECRAVGGNGYPTDEAAYRAQGFNETHRVHLTLAGRPASYAVLQRWSLDSGANSDFTTRFWPFDLGFLHGGPSPLDRRPSP